MGMMVPSAPLGFLDSTRNDRPGRHKNPLPSLNTKSVSHYPALPDPTAR